ncbi:hypothetical protein F3J30_10025 [Enterobacter sp. Tr-810]|nr:hypothetical protein [Enterobacter sp. Tr-810]
MFELHVSTFVCSGEPKVCAMGGELTREGEIQATKNPSTLNQNGGVDGLHKLGTSKKSSGTNYDYPQKEKFCAYLKYFRLCANFLFIPVLAR